MDTANNTKKDLKLYFSLTTGDLYYVEADEIKNLDEAQVPLIQKPNPRCHKCFGRFYTGRHHKMSEGKWVPDYYQMCPNCLKKCVDFEAIKDKELKVYTPKTTTELADQTFVDAVKDVHD